MTILEFICEHSGDRLTVEPVKGNIELVIKDSELVEQSVISLTIKDAEMLIDEIHRAIIKAEGGEND